MVQDVWNAALSEIREVVPPSQFQTWIQPVEFLRSDSKSIWLGVPNSFHEQWILNNYLEIVRAAINRHGGADLQLQFEIFVREENEHAARSTMDATSVATPGRPQLRVVQSDEEGFVEPILKPNYPKHQNPFFEFAYNKTAFRLAELFAQSPDASLRSVVLQSSVGMGKTHLLSHIGDIVAIQNPMARIRYVNFDGFTSEMVTAIKDNTMHEFRKKYREETDCLLFDDVQGLSGRKRTQEELLHICNEITAKNGRIAFTTSLPVQKIGELIDPLRSRLTAAVSAEIQLPSFEDKVMLLKRISSHNQIDAPESFLRNLVDQGQNDVRELVGTLLRVHLQARLENREFGIEDTRIANRVKRPQITMQDIVGLVEVSFELSREELLSKGRKSNVAWARQVAMYLGRHFTQLSLGEIGKIFGRDHATVIHAFDKVKEVMKDDHQRRYEVEYLVEKLQARMPKAEDAPTL